MHFIISLKRKTYQMFRYRKTKIFCHQYIKHIIHIKFMWHNNSAKKKDIKVIAEKKYLLQIY